jgi:hypothetical protein
VSQSLQASSFILFYLQTPLSWLWKKKEKFFVSVLLAKIILLGNFSLGCMLNGRDYGVTWTMSLWHH